MRKPIVRQLQARPEKSLRALTGDTRNKIMSPGGPPYALSVNKLT